MQYADAVLAQNDADAVKLDGDEATAKQRRAERDAKQTGWHKKICLTGAEATMATTARNRRLEPAYKQHTAVDDVFGVVLDVEVTTGETNEGGHILPQIDAVGATTGTHSNTVTADCPARSESDPRAASWRNVAGYSNVAGLAPPIPW